MNLNIISARLSLNRIIGVLYFSLTIATAIPKTMLKITICKIWPSNIAFAIFSGKICRIKSPGVWALIFAIAGTSGFGGKTTPTPAFPIFIASSPINSAIVDTISKYKSDFHPILPICLISACPAIPTTRVEKRSGAIMVFIIRRKMSLKTWSFFATSGTSYPNSAPAIIHTRIHVVRERFRSA